MRAPAPQTDRTTSAAPPVPADAAAARVWRKKAGRVAGIVLTTAVVELALWWYLLDSMFYRDFFKPVSVVVLIAALSAVWRVVRGRAGDRRGGDRRGSERRDSPAEGPGAP